MLAAFYFTTLLQWRWVSGSGEANPWLFQCVFLYLGMLSLHCHCIWDHCHTEKLSCCQSDAFQIPVSWLLFILASIWNFKFGFITPSNLFLLIFSQVLMKSGIPEDMTFRCCSSAVIVFLYWPLLILSSTCSHCSNILSTTNRAVCFYLFENHLVSAHKILTVIFVLSLAFVFRCSNIWEQIMCFCDRLLITKCQFKCFSLLSCPMYISLFLDIDAFLVHFCAWMIQRVLSALRKTNKTSENGEHKDWNENEWKSRQYPKKNSKRLS